MKYATDNHLLTERMVEFFADYLNQLQDKAAKPDAPTSSKGEEQPPVLEVPEYTGPYGTAGEEAAVHDLPEFKGGVNAAEAAVHDLPEFKGWSQCSSSLGKRIARIQRWSQCSSSSCK